MIELITVMIILGILAVVAIPRMNTGSYRELEFHDRSVAALRFAQKTATSHRRMVCVDFPSASKVKLAIDATKTTTACGADLNLPGGSTPELTSGDPTNAKFDPVPAAFNFQPDGTVAAAVPQIKIAGQPDIVVVGATGHVQ